MRRAALALLVLAAGCKKDEAAAEEKAAPVEVHCVSPSMVSVDESVSLRGHIEPPPGGDLSIAPQVAGRLATVVVREGQAIASGDLVATVDAAPSQDALRQAEAAVAQARAAEVNASLALERSRALVARGIAAKQELEDAVAKEDAARASVSAANASADLARRTLGKVAVRSSFAGVVTKLWRGPGALVDGTAATPVVQLAASSGVDFVADVTQRELVRIREGQAVKGQLVQGGEPFEGVVRARSTALDPATGLGTVRVALKATTARAPIGSFGRVEIATGHREGVMVLPRAALRGSVSDGAEIALCKEGKAEIHTVKVGWRGPLRFEITEGVTEKDSVAIDHVLGLDNDTPLKVLAGAPEGEDDAGAPVKREDVEEK